MALKLKMAAAITGDVVASSRLNTLKRRRLQEKIKQFSQLFTKQFPDLQMQQYRGDSLQATLTTNRIFALNMALQLQSLLAINGIKIRLGIALGEISFSNTDVTISDGTALQLSGPLADELKKRNDLIAVTAANDAFSKEWIVHSASLNFLIERLSAAQAEALYLQLQNLKQEDIARKLKISQPSVHQRLEAAGAQVIASIVQRFEESVPFL
ncbi:MAG: sigma factor-like helix-turn-helix DNA-binding protein [Parafilimonas sp.]